MPLAAAYSAAGEASAGTQTETPAQTDTSNGIAEDRLFQATVSLPSPADKFTDVNRNAWYYNAVVYVTENGFFSGTSDETFEPSAYMSRAMAVTVLGRMAGIDIRRFKNGTEFTDVKSGSWYEPYVAWATRYGIVSGTGNGKFSPDTPITIQELAAFFVRYFRIFGVSLQDTDLLNTMPDDEERVSDWAYESVQVLWARSMMVGDGSGNFQPRKRITRAEGAQLAMTLFQATDKWHPYPGTESWRPVTPGGDGFYTVTFLNEAGGVITQYSVPIGQGIADADVPYYADPDPDYGICFWGWTFDDAEGRPRIYNNLYAYNTDMTVQALCITQAEYAKYVEDQSYIISGDVTTDFTVLVRPKNKVDITNVTDNGDGTITCTFRELESDELNQIFYIPDVIPFRLAEFPDNTVGATGTVENYSAYDYNLYYEYSGNQAPNPRTGDFVLLYTDEIDFYGEDDFERMRSSTYTGEEPYVYGKNTSIDGKKLNYSVVTRKDVEEAVNYFENCNFERYIPEKMIPEFTEEQMDAFEAETEELLDEEALRAFVFASIETDAESGDENAQQALEILQTESIAYRQGKLIGRGYAPDDSKRVEITGKQVAGDFTKKQKYLKKADGNDVTAQLHLFKDGEEIVINDTYSVATYAYNQLNREEMDAATKTVCANLLRYASYAQLFKATRTDALPDAAMTDAHRAYLADLDTVTYSDRYAVLDDLANPSVTWVGKTFQMNTRVELMFVCNLANFTGNRENLHLVVNYTDYTGTAKTYDVPNSRMLRYNPNNDTWYFCADCMRSADMRTVLSVAVYEGETQVSTTMQYSVESYAVNKTGLTLELCKALLAYSDSCLTKFT